MSVNLSVSVSRSSRGFVKLCETLRVGPSPQVLQLQLASGQIGLPVLSRVEEVVIIRSEPEVEMEIKILDLVIQILAQVDNFTYVKE